MLNLLFTIDRHQVVMSIGIRGSSYVQRHDVGTARRSKLMQICI